MNDSEFAATARHLASRLASLATFDATASPSWAGDDVDPVRSEQSGRPVLVHGLVDDGLLTGRAGIAVALAACSVLPSGSSAWATLAQQTMHGILATPADPRLGGLGWQSGDLGIAWAAALVGGLTSDQDLPAAGRARASLAVRAMQADEALCPAYADLLDGEAGHLAAVLAADLPAADEPTRRNLARRLADRIAARATRDARGASWLMGGYAPSVVGLAHGGSGIALALVAAEAAGVGDHDGLRAEALRWEDGHYNADRGGWPDLRMDGEVPGLAWCHGAPGVGIGAAYRSTVLGDPGAEITYARARRAAAAHRSFGSPFDGTLCHGLSGIVELHLAGAEAWPASAKEHLRTARLVARHITRAGTDGRPRWTCGISGGRTPNVLVGLAGVAITLVRCHDPGIVPTLGHPGLPHPSALTGDIPRSSRLRNSSEADPAPRVPHPGSGTPVKSTLQA
jgi:lantibiotic modifying enzyme